MTNEEFELAFKRFSRCMKEHGHYKFIMSYLFPEGRTKEDLLKEINNEQYNTNFSMLLCYINLLGPSYNKLGNDYWHQHISKLYTIWQYECEEKYVEYLNHM